MVYKFAAMHGELKGANRSCCVCLQPATAMQLNAFDESYSRPVCMSMDCRKAAPDAD